MRIFKKKIVSILILLLIIVCCVSCTTKDKISEIDKNTLQIVKSDFTLTQEQVVSQIKADHLKENNGYIDSDEIIVLVTLSDKALIDSYNEDYSTIYNTIAEYSDSEKGIEQINSINEKQEKLIERLNSKGLIDKVEYTYSTITNAIAIKTTYGKLDDITKTTGVSNIIISDTYNKPQDTTGDETSAIENIVDVYETGIFNSSSVSYTGNKTAVAILDSGFDCSHSVFSNQPSQLLLTQQSISKVMEQTQASSKTKGLELTDVYYSNKIPFVYDYADKDPDVFPYDSEHGTHVAGIIGGKDNKITGVAVNTQLVLLKVFPDLDSGANTDDILAALEDAVLLGVDAINMSLGSACGFSREIDEENVNKIYDKIDDSGISLITAASNSYSSGYGGAQGNTNMVTNPDSGTVGSPSTYKASLSVASISGVKSKYIVGNDSQIFFFHESNAVTGDENDFFKELGITEGETKTYDYVTIPGVGLKVNYSTLGNLSGKIALIRRGDNTFEEKALNAKNAGAVACIIYNNIDGDIIMSMGKTDHIPTISISKDDGTKLASLDNGKLTISYNYQAGPFMSDFSSWGPTPSLELKPEITAHGGNILSSVPGGEYDELSGTSMACPNLCGIVVLIRQYLKEKYPTYTSKEISVLANELLMSTATIIQNQEGNPYSPRKQGAGLASLYNAVNTNAYLTVDGKDRTKLELFDDALRTGVYTMNFNVVNTSLNDLTYDLSVIAMTESVSTSDNEHVSEKAQLLNGTPKYEIVSGGTLNGNTLTVNKNTTCKIKVVYTLSQSDKDLIDSLFPYGMYVEGFVKLTSSTGNEINLSIPFLAFYGDWTEAPLFDKTYYEVESEAHDASIDEEDKLKADYYATTPYGSYYYNYIIPLGTYLYDVDKEIYDEIPASEEKIAISDILGTIDGISSIYAGLLRNARSVTFTIVNKVTGEVVYEHIDYNATKAYSNGGSQIPYYDYLKIKSKDLELVNNTQYEFKMAALLDYGDGGVNTNKRNTFSFDFYLDNEAPVLKNASYEKTYDKTLKKDRYYITLDVYDNQYVQSITPIIFTSSSSYNFLTENPIPVYGEKGETTSVKFEITDYLEDIYADKLITSALAFSIDDYALNSNIFICQLPGTKGDFKFTKDGTLDGTDMIILSMNEGEVVDLTKYLATADTSVDENKDYLKYLEWTSSNEKVAEVKEGLVKCLKTGRATITVKETLDLKQAVLIINVKAKDEAKNKVSNTEIDKRNLNYEDETIDSIRFSYFDTLFAYSRAAQTSQIGETGNRIFISSLSTLSFYPGEKIQLSYDFDPWYAKDKYELVYSSTNPDVASVDEDGIVTGLKEGNTSIVLKVNGSTLMARLRITIKSEFVIENRTLIAYKGLGGNVVIPDDEGIMYIGSYAFCLYDTDRTIELSDDDYDANKIPSMNTSIKSITIPYGVEEIQKYAFYNCSGLEKVVLPTTVKYVREYAFCKDEKLKEINLENVLVIGREAFYNCNSLTSVDFSKIYAIGVSAFEDCSSLKTVDLTNLRNTGERAFKDCTSLTSVVLGENTKLSYAMFVNSGLTNVDIYSTASIPQFCFAQCKKLAKVTIHNDIIEIGKGAFSECLVLNDFNLLGKVEILADQVFYGTIGLTSISLPNNDVEIGAYCFYKCNNLAEVKLGASTQITNVYGTIFEDTKVSNFVVDSNNPYYTADNNLLLSKDGKTIILASIANEYSDYTIDNKYDTIAKGAFSGSKITSLTITNKNLIIDEYAFANCKELLTVTFANEIGNKVNAYAFSGCSSLTTLNNLDKVMNVGQYAFGSTGVTNVTTGANSTYGEGAFFKSKVVAVTLGSNSKYGMGTFQNCANLKVVNMPENGGVHFGNACFGYDAALEIIDLSKVDSVLEKETFYGCKSLKVANLLNVKEVGDYAFADCSSLNYVSIPVVEIIGEGAFARYDTYGGAPVINEINLPSTLVEIKDGAFLGCEGIEEVILPSSITTYGNYLFAYCKNLIKVQLPTNMTKIGEYSFAGCENLSTINLENVIEIDDYAFTSDYSLKTIDLSKIKTIGVGSFASSIVKGSLIMNDLTSVGDYAFQGTSIETITAPNLKKIGIGAFQNDKELKEFVLSNDIEEVSTIAFLGCKKLESFYFNNGTKSNNGKINDYAYLDNGILYTILKTNHYELTSVPSNMKINTLAVLEDTYRIDLYAGNENENIEKVILPDTLKMIGNYAFYGYSKLKEVEFKSFTAPALEDSYNSNSTLEDGDPGYDIIHSIFDLFGEELYYYTFIDLVGKNKPIKMILPSNKDIIGYNSIVYQTYFGSVEDSQRSEYEAKEKNMNEFVDYAAKIAKIKTVILTDEDLINNALTCYNSIKQDPTKYGYTIEEWNNMVNIVKKAKTDLVALKFENANQTVKNVQVEINNLPSVFDITKLTTLQNINTKINNLKLEERALLDLSKFNTLVTSYNEYVKTVNNESVSIDTVVNSSIVYISLATTGLISLVGIALFVLKKSIFM